VVGGRLSAVIDFDGLGVSDPAHDVATVRAALAYLTSPRQSLPSQ
jgi:aminoglycoside phosphotransferase (APT) family kinase protein